MRALQRVMAILSAVADAPEPQTPARVARTTALSLSTVARMMREMADEGLLERSERDGSYALGTRLYRIVQAGARYSDPVSSIRPILTEVRDATGETTSLHVRNRGQRVCIAEVQSQHDLRRVVPLGLALSLYGTATGEVLLAGAPPEEREQELDDLGLSTSEHAELEARLTKIRAQGWAIVSDRWLQGVTGLSVAVRNQGTTIAALSASGPTSRFTPEIAENHVPLLIDAADRVATHLAAHP